MKFAKERKTPILSLFSEGFLAFSWSERFLIFLPHKSPKVSLQVLLVGIFSIFFLTSFVSMRITFS